MEDWKSLIDQAMQQEHTDDLIAAYTTYGGAVRSALSNAQLLLGDLGSGPDYGINLRSIGRLFATSNDSNESRRP